MTMMAEPVSEFLDSMRLLVDLQQVNEIARGFSGCLDPEAIAKRTTDHLVEKFDCAFARIWLVESDQTTLRLVASSGMYTHTNGSFAKVPMGAFKVGKIAQNRIPFLSNRLADEAWVKDREWAIANSITGFAGYPLAVSANVVGVLAIFSHHPLSSEFLEVLQSLCTTLTISLETALHYQRAQQAWQSNIVSGRQALSEQVASLLKQTRLSLVGTERSLSPALTYVVLRVAEILGETNCHHCRLTYGEAAVVLEAMIFSTLPPQFLPDWATSTFGDILFAVSCLGGTLQTYVGANQKVIQVVLNIPYIREFEAEKLPVRIQCRSPVLQMAFTHLAYLAGLTVSTFPDAAVPLLTDDVEQLAMSDRVLWLDQANQLMPKGAIGKVDLSINPEQFRAAVAAVAREERWGLREPEQQGLSEREQEIMTLLAQGLRDRDIANHLHISERTVKFHVNNILPKLKAKTRFQALYQAMHNGWMN